MEKESLIADSPKKESISEEKLMKELDTVAKEILARNEEETTKKLLTNPSAIALTTTQHSAGEGVSNVRKTVKQLFTLYLTNQYIARAINVRADTLVSRGYDIVGYDKTGVNLCTELVDNSGGISLFNRLSTNTDIAGDGFLEKVYNLNKTKILRLKHVHPLTLSFKKHPETNKIMIDADKQPIGYVQYYLDDKGVERTKDVNKDRIAHFMFNILGDEFSGLSIIQPGYDTIVRLMNMEYSAAESAVKIANPIIVGKCNTKSPHQIAMWGTILGQINGREQVFIPEGMELDTLSPGQQNFSEYASYFLNSVVATSGVPKGVLLGDTGGSGNRAEGIILTRHFYSGIRGNQKTMELFFNEIFKEYGKLAGFKPPKLVFEDVAEDANVNMDSAVNLLQAGIINIREARTMIGLDTPQSKKFVNIAKEIKQSDMETWHPAEPGSPTGSQKNVKSKEKKSPFSEFKGDGKKNI